MKWPAWLFRKKLKTDDRILTYANWINEITYAILLCFSAKIERTKHFALNVQGIIMESSPAFFSIMSLHCLRPYASLICLRRIPIRVKVIGIVKDTRQWALRQEFALQTAHSHLNQQSSTNSILHFGTAEAWIFESLKLVLKLILILILNSPKKLMCDLILRVRNIDWSFKFRAILEVSSWVTVVSCVTSHVLRIRSVLLRSAVHSFTLLDVVQQFHSNSRRVR